MARKEGGEGGQDGNREGRRVRTLITGGGYLLLAFIPKSLTHPFNLPPRHSSLHHPCIHPSNHLRFRVSAFPCFLLTLPLHPYILAPSHPHTPAASLCLLPRPAC